MKLKTKYAAGMRGELEGMLGCPVEVVEDREAKYPCKMEYARNYGRDRHVVRVNPARCVSEYPVFMMMLATKLQLRKTADGELGVQQAVSSREEISRFEADVRCDRVGAALMMRQGRNADGVVNMLCGGLCTQCSSQIVELLAADVVLKDYPDAVEDMKRYLAAAAVEGAGLSHEKLLAIYPEFVVTANRRLNLLFAMKSGEVCGKKLIDAYDPTPDEIDAALDLYGLYRSERDALLASGKIAGDVVARLMKELKVDCYAHLAVLEIAPVKPSPSADDGLTEEQRKALTDFYAHHGDGKCDAELMTLGLFKVLRELRGWPLEAVRTLAVEIAMLGAQGINPTKKYALKSLPNRGEMYGEEILAYYYVTWAKAFPDKLDMLGLPYKVAYASALSMSEHLK